ncbi:hypothetical protein AB0J63_07010 [Streptosporangium canum]|uniref:hypothetical protein n=1 Tax=Streptosporangium canum TaxID=324952 RepID=UPI00342DA3A2
MKTATDKLTWLRAIGAHQMDVMILLGPAKPDTGGRRPLRPVQPRELGPTP